MIDKKQLRKVVEDTLKYINLYSEDATNLILGTIAQESAGGKYIQQLGSGVAQGICQMEAATFWDIVDRYLRFKPNLKLLIEDVANIRDWKASSLTTNLIFSIAMCRVHYLRDSKPIPSDLEGQAAVWKRCYNTHLGAGTEEEYIRNYKKYVE